MQKMIKHVRKAGPIQRVDTKEIPRELIYRTSMVSCQKDPTRHAYALQIWPFWQDTLDIRIPIPLVSVGWGVQRLTQVFKSLHDSQKRVKHKIQSENLQTHKFSL